MLSARGSERCHKRCHVERECLRHRKSGMRELSRVREPSKASATNVIEHMTIEGGLVGSVTSAQRVILSRLRNIIGEAFKMLSVESPLL